MGDAVQVDGTLLDGVSHGREVERARSWLSVRPLARPPSPTRVAPISLHALIDA